MDYKEKLTKDKKNANVIPFIVKEDVKPFNKKISSTDELINTIGLLGFVLFILLETFIGFYVFIVILILTIILIIFHQISKKQFQKIKCELQEKCCYFSIVQDKVIIYKNNHYFGDYLLKEVQVKPTLYLESIYIYKISCPNIVFGDCYVLIDDSLNLKQSFTFLGKPSYDEEELKENEY